MEPWGEGYEGQWIDGYKDGVGIYKRPDGVRIPVRWGRGGGSWYTDQTSGCRFWWKASPDPVGESIWSGACVDGKANGEGTVIWSVADNGAPLESEVTFVGTIIEGYLQGEGTWREVDYYSNVERTTVFDGTWKDGLRTGFGVETKVGEYRKGDSFDQITVTYEGEWAAGVYDGIGRREEVKHYTSGRVDTLIEEGFFADNMLNGEGISFQRATEVNGDNWSEKAEGKFENRSFRGFGEIIYERTTGELVFSSSAKYAAEIWSGGVGFVNYPDGSRFEGELDATGSPVSGDCRFTSTNYNGACIARAVNTSEWSGELWLVSPDDPEKCLKIIQAWVS